MFAESFSTAWNLRFGNEAPEIPVDAFFLRHRSVRDYSDRPVPENLVASLVGAAQSAATSSNLQLWSLISVQESTLREKIAAAAAGQRQVKNAPWFFAFVADHHRLQRAAIASGQSPNGLDYIEFFIMAVIDAALAAERMVCAAESVGLSICYIGAMRNDPRRIAELLHLPEGTFVPFGLCLGYPIENSVSNVKPRLEAKSVWFRERYPVYLDTSEYDLRMREFYESEGMKGDVTWSMRSGRRVDENHLTGREVLDYWLKTRGFNAR
jgi:nitroreductase